MAIIDINLITLIQPGITDSISGRDIGQNFAEINKVIDKLDENSFRVIISDDIKAINDSFIKGFFSKVFEKLKTVKNVSGKFEIVGDPYFLELFKKNFKILESIYNE